MFWKEKEKTKLDKAIEDRVDLLDSVIADPDEDRKIIDNLKDLADIKVQVEGTKHTINPNTIIGAVGSLAGVILILNYERLGVVTSKALNFIPKFKN